jgi:CRP-like cAMP-binding protein
MAPLKSADFDFQSQLPNRRDCRVRIKKAVTVSERGLVMVKLRPRVKDRCLRARDLSSGHHLPFTQEFLAEMLGIRRTSVTTVAGTLQEAGMVKYSRGKIEILDVEGLREGACECYETVKEQYGQLLSTP